MVQRLSQISMSPGRQTCVQTTAGVGCGGPEFVQQRFAFRFVELDDMARRRLVAAPEIERRAAGDRVPAQEGVDRSRNLVARGRRGHGRAEAAGRVARGIVPDGEPRKPAAGRLGQALIGGILVGEGGVAAAVHGHLVGVEDRAFRRLLDIGIVGMPGEFLAARAGMAARRLAGLVEVRDDRDARQAADAPGLHAVAALQVVGTRARLLRPAERLRQCQQVFVGERLAPEQQHQMVGPGPLEGFRIQRRRKVRAPDFGAERIAARHDFERHRSPSRPIGPQRL